MRDLLLHQIAKLESEEAVALDTALLLTNTLVQRRDISAYDLWNWGICTYLQAKNNTRENRSRHADRVSELTAAEKRERDSMPASSTSTAAAASSPILEVDYKVCFGWLDGTCQKEICPKGWAHPPKPVTFDYNPVIL